MDHHAHTATARRGRLRTATLALLLALAGAPVLAADPQLYEVTIAPTGNAALDQAVRDASTLVSLRETAPVGPFALVGRARGDAERLQAALDSFGYYKGEVAITIAGRRLDDPDLPGLLDATPEGRPVPVAVTLTPGPLFRLRRVELTGDPTQAVRDALLLAPGDPARAADVLAARGRMQTALLDTGHALARVGAPVATLVPADNALDVAFPVEAGPRVDLGRIAISGEDRLDPDYIRRRLRLQPGDPFDPAAIEKARQDLAAVPALGGVRIIPSDTLDSEGRLPMQVEVSERPRRAVDFGAAWSTDQGGSLSASWTHRNLFGEAEQLTLGAAVTQLGGTASQQPGYNAFATYVVPDWLRRGQSLTFNLQAVREYLQAYDRTAAIAGAALARRLTDEITVSGGLLFTKEQIVQEGVTTNYTLFQVPLAVRYDTTKDLFDPTQGIRSALTLTPTYALGGSDTPNATFLIAQLSASTYLDIGNWIVGTEGRSILALRGLIGTIRGAGVFELPPDQRFYAGGGGSIRGFRFQSVGPQFPDGRPTGGNAVDTGSIEVRQRFGESWGAAVFVDAGQVGTNGVPFNGRVAVGAGAGVRYFTPIGPIRADFAVPINKETKGDAFEIYVGIGQAF